MNIRKIVTYNNLRRQFTPEELIFANELYDASESDRQLLVEALQPAKVVKKSSKKPASKSPRASGMQAQLNKNLQREPHCVVCYAVRDHVNHNVDNGGHEFSTDLAKRVNESLDTYNERCTATRDGGRACGLLLDHNVHQMTSAMGYHEFVSEQGQAASGD